MGDRSIVMHFGDCLDVLRSYPDAYPWHLVLPDGVADRLALVDLLVESLNNLDAQIARRELRGKDADGRAFLREEIAAAQRLSDRIMASMPRSDVIAHYERQRQEARCSTP